MLWVRLCRHGDPAVAPRLACPARHCVLWQWREVARGRAPLAIVRGIWGWALTLPRLSVMEAGGRVPVFCCFGAEGAGMGAWHPLHIACSCQLALGAAGVAEGHPQGGCLVPS